MDKWMEATALPDILTWSVMKMTKDVTLILQQVKDGQDNNNDTHHQHNDAEAKPDKHINTTNS